jgi:hypothetical protein
MVLITSSNRVRAKESAFRLGGAALALALFTQIAPLPAEAQSEQRRAKQASRPAPVQALRTEGPLVSLVSLNQQRMFVYDANGFVVQTRVSSGRTGHETPKGIYSILEKKVDHTSNIYLDAKMPHMQRLTMTGIALHGGVVPGYPASGGCVRLPFDFARRFFSMTDLGQRVIIAPDVHAPIAFEHNLLFAALPSAAPSVPDQRADGGVGSKAIQVGSDVAETLLGVTTAHAATEPQTGRVRTQESAAEERRAERARLAEAVSVSEERLTKAVERQKAAQDALSEARKTAKAAAAASVRAARAASKAQATLKTAERALKRAASRIPEDTSKVRSDRLDALRARSVSTCARVAAATEDVRVTDEAAKAAAEASEAAKQAAEDAQAALKVARTEIKDAGDAEKNAKRALAAFDRQEKNRELPVSVFVSSATGTVSIRQGNEEVLTAQAEIENPEVPLDTFLFTAVKWKDENVRTDLVWQATEVTDDENAMFVSVADDGSSRRNKKSANQSVPLPPATDSAKAARTLDRIKLPKHVSDRVAEVVKPGSVLIVSSYDVSRSEMKYPGTDFIVQMPEVVAKITKPTPRPRPVEVVEEDRGGGFFFFGPSNYSSSYYRDRDRERDRRKRRTGSSKSFFW